MAAGHDLTSSSDTVLGAARVKACLGKTKELMRTSLSKRFRLLGAGIGGGGADSYDARVSDVSKMAKGDLKTFLMVPLDNVRQAADE